MQTDRKRTDGAGVAELPPRTYAPLSRGEKRLRENYSAPANTRHAHSREAVIPVLLAREEPADVIRRR